MNDTSLTEFGRIDQTGDAGTFVQFLDSACAHDSFKAYKRNLLTCMNLSPGGRALDVGCGTGDDVREMASTVGAAGCSVGVDNSAAMIEEARRRADALPGLEFHVASATALPFEAGHFDATRADRSLMHVPDAIRALAEMVRVTRSGGRVVIYEVDFGTVVIDTDERHLARTVLDAWCAGLRDPWLGRRFPALFVEHGLTEVAVAPFVLTLTPPLALPILGAATTARAVRAGTLPQDEAERWLRHLDTLQQTGRFFSTLTGFLVAGTKG